MLKAALREISAPAVITGSETAAPGPRIVLVNPALAGLPGQVFLVVVLLACDGSASETASPVTFVSAPSIYQ